MNSPDQALYGKVAVVTGASRRAGQATALGLARHGAAVVLNARSSADELEATVAAIRARGGRAFSHLADVTEEAAVTSMFERVHAEFGGCDILVNNAAIRQLRSFLDMSLAEWHQVTSVILDGAFLCARAAIAQMLQRGGGTIINIGGLSAHTGASDRAHVVTAKSGLVGFTKALAVEFGSAGIRVNCVVPGRIGGPRSESAGQVPSSTSLAQPALGRAGTVDEVAEVTLALTLPSGAYMTGQTIHVNGGLYFP